MGYYLKNALFAAETIITYIPSINYSEWWVVILTQLIW